jgi:hypothetical protein
MLTLKEIQLIQSAILCTLTDENMDYKMTDKYMDLEDKLERIKKSLS